MPLVGLGFLYIMNYIILYMSLNDGSFGKTECLEGMEW